MTTNGLVTIELDVANLDDSTSFWATLLGFRVLGSRRPGTVLESRTLASDAFPTLALVLRNCNPRPPAGSALGSLRTIEFQVDDPVALARRLDNPQWVLAPPEDDAEPCDRVILQDSSGYHVALTRPPRPEGSA